MTGLEPKHRDWIKLWIKESLVGTVREDLTSEERGMWYDFLLLAGNSRVAGVICSNENTPMPVKRIAGILNVSEKLVERCISKFAESGRITVGATGLLHIANWDRYQYSDYDRVKKHREKQRAAARNTNGRWLAMPEDERRLAVEEFGPCDSWDMMTWVAVTGKLPDSERAKIEEATGQELDV